MTARAELFEKIKRSRANERWRVRNDKEQSQIRLTLDLRGVRARIIANYLEGRVRV